MDDSDDFPNLPSELVLTEEPQKDDFYLWVFYKGQFAYKCHIRDEAGCMIYGSCLQDEEAEEEVHVGLQDKMSRLHLGERPRSTGKDWVNINLPQPTSVDYVRQRHLDRINKCLEAMGDGIRIKRDKEDGCIYGEKTLNCCHIYHAFPMIELEYSQNDCLPLLLPNKRDKCLFNPKKYWQRFDEQPHRHERPKAVLSVGERWSLTKSLETCSISMTVINALDLYKYQQKVNPCPIEVSPESSLDYMGDGEGACETPTTSCDTKKPG